MATRRFGAPSRDQQAPEAIAARWDAATENDRNLAPRFSFLFCCYSDAMRSDGDIAPPASGKRTMVLPGTWTVTVFSPASATFDATR